MSRPGFTGSEGGSERSGSERTRKFLETTGAPRRLTEFDPRKLDWGEAATDVAEVLALGDRLAKGEERDVSVALTGAFGVGKTLLAVHLLRRAWDFWFWSPRSTSRLDFPRFFRATDLAELRFKRNFGGEDDEEDRRGGEREALARAPLVVIDDVQRVAGYRGEEVYLETVLERRHDDRLATVLTANRLPEDDTRFADFLRYFEVFPINGESHRGR
jgi:hypothetical protein